MARALKKLVKSYLPGGLLSEGEVGEIVFKIEGVIDRLPGPMGKAFKAFLAAHAYIIDPVATLERLDRGGGRGHWLAIAVNTIVRLGVYSHPKVLRALGIDEDACPEGGTDDRPHPDPVACEDFAGLREENPSADIVVVGSGPGGAMAAYVLAKAGHSVLVLEEGPAVRPSELRSVIDAVLKLYVDGMGIASEGSGHFIPIMTAKGPGGTAVVNMGTCLWPRPDVIAAWGLDPADFDRRKPEIEQLYGVRCAAMSLMGHQNIIMARGCAKLGIPVEAIPRNAINRRNGAACIVGGESARKLSPDRSILPLAVQAGARILAGCRARKIHLQSFGRARGVYAEDRNGRTRFVSAAKAVVLAAGAIGTPLLLQDSGIGNAAVGRASFFQVNGNVVGLMDEDVRSFIGIEQGMVSRKWEQDGIVLESISTRPALTAPYLPGPASRHWIEMKAFGRFCQTGFIVDANRTPVRIGRKWGAPHITHAMSDGDAELVRRGSRLCAEILFAAGAKKALVPGWKEWASSYEEAERKLAAMRTSDIHVVSAHFIGTCAMGKDPATSAVALDGRVRGAENLYVADCSLLPTALGVNPQMTILANAMRIAEGI